ncbi:MAG: hypothetical protein AAF289_13400 [Cyanobacteria bacterium P01_A01_bin.135]
MTTHLPPPDVRQVALILGLTHLHPGTDGQWQARDRYDNEFTIAPSLVEATLGQCELTSVASAQPFDQAV